MNKERETAEIRKSEDRMVNNEENKLLIGKKSAEFSVENLIGKLLWIRLKNVKAAGEAEIVTEFIKYLQKVWLSEKQKF